MNKLEDYTDYEFETNTTRTEEYISFERKYRNHLKKILPDGYSLHSFNGNHFCFSCVIKSNTNDFIYLSIDDVRGGHNHWKDHILIRQMEHEKDWHGQGNFYTNLKRLPRDLEHLNQRGYVSYRNNDDYFL